MVFQRKSSKWATWRLSDWSLLWIWGSLTFRKTFKNLHRLHFQWHVNIPQFKQHEIWQFLNVEAKNLLASNTVQYSLQVIPNVPFSTTSFQLLYSSLCVCVCDGGEEAGFVRRNTLIHSSLRGTLRSLHLLKNGVSFLLSTSELQKKCNPAWSWVEMTVWRLDISALIHISDVTLSHTFWMVLL